MIDELKELIDKCKNNPTITKILLKVGNMPEKKQKKVIILINRIINNKRKKDGK